MIEYEYLYTVYCDTDRCWEHRRTVRPDHNGVWAEAEAAGWKREHGAHLCPECVKVAANE